MKYSVLVALSAVLLAGCVPGGDPLLPELSGRWAPERGAQVRVAAASANASVPIRAPSTKELCQSEFVTFSKGPTTPGTLGAVFLYRNGGRLPMFVVREAKRGGERIVLTGHDHLFDALAGENQGRIELILHYDAITFDNLFDQRGRSIRYDLFKAPDPLGARRANVTTVGDVYRMLFDLKRCAA
jgi:hypothetical protein